MSPLNTVHYRVMLMNCNPAKCLFTLILCLCAAGLFAYEGPENADPVDMKVMESINHQLHLDTLQRGRKAYRADGEYIPDFALWNQDEQLVTRDTLKGKPIVITFIFTRCMVAKMCPATTAKMERLQREAAEAGITDAHFILVTFDPEYDSPTVLKAYGDQRGFNEENTMLLTGDPEAIDDLMKQFGILTIEEDDTINHTSSTLLVDDKGKILFRQTGSGWTPEPFLERLKALQAHS